MADHHQIVDQIRAFVQSSDQTRNGFLESLASTYAEACVEANHRMGRCHRLLQQGLRSEAIQLAESQPRLLDSLAALDFPERSDWDELVQIYDLARAPTLAIDQALFLNDAYAQEDPLQDLLRMHRRLALQRAPIKSRIGVMRKLAAQDAGNPIWTDDLRTFEKARYREVQVAAAQAVQCRDLSVIGQLLGEIDQQTWVEPPPKALVQGLRKADAQFRGQQTRARLTDLDARLSDAFAARDTIRGRLARQEWIALTATAPLEPTDPIWARVQDPLYWLEEEDRRDELDHAHEEALRALVVALDDPAHIAPAELERLAHAVLQYGRGMPEEIQRRYVARLRSAETRQTKRWRLIAGTAAAGVFLTGGVAFYIMRSWARSSDAIQAASTILEMIELGQVEQASGFLEKVLKADAGLLAYPPMIEAHQKFQTIKDQETARALQFDNAIRAAEHAPIDQLNPPELMAARQLARQQSEKQAIEKVVQRRKAALEAERSKHETVVGPRLDELGRKLAEAQQKVESARPGDRDPKAILELLAEARRELADIGPQLPFVGDNLQAQATVLGQKIDAISARLEVRRRQERLEEDITDSTAYSANNRTGDLVKFAGLLESYIRLAPDEARAQALRQTIGERSLWDDVDAWNRLAQEWSDGLAGGAPRDPRIRAERCGRFLLQHKGTPDAAAIAAYQKYLETIDRRGPGADSATAKLQRLLSDILVENLWSLKIRESGARVKTYYLESPPADNSVLIKHLIGFDAKKRNTPIVKTSIVYSGLSPQSKISKHFKPILIRDSTRTDWEKVMIDLANRIRIEPEIDPVLQVALLRGVLEQAADGSEPLREALTTTRGILEHGDVNVNVPWMDPEDADAGKVRPRAAQIVQMLPDLSDVLKKSLDRRDQIERDVHRLPRSVGWLSFKVGGWHLRRRSLPPSRFDLWVVAPQGEKQGRWQKVGAIADGKAQISAGAKASMAEGRPVFVMTEPTD